MANRRRLVLRLLLVTACGAVLVWTVSALGPRQVLHAALEADPLWLALSIFPVIGRFLIWGVKWRRMLARRSAVPYWFCMRLLAAGSFFNLITPTAKLAGGVVRAVLLHRRHGWGLPGAYGWAMADQATNVLGHLLLYGLLALASAPALPAGPVRMALFGSGMAALAGIGLIMALRGWAWRLLSRPRVGERLVRMIPSRLRGKDPEGSPELWLQEIFSPLLHQGSALTTFLPDLAWAALGFASLCIASAMVLKALGAEAPLLLISTAVVLAYFIGLAVGAWGGIGVTEAALTGLYVQIGIPGELAAAGALLHRAILYAIVLGLGGVALLREKRLGKEPLSRQ
jgi:uncharacterized membrane protein YbhN (UPF0104 family)